MVSVTCLSVVLVVSIVSFESVLSCPTSLSHGQASSGQDMVPVEPLPTHNRMKRHPYGPPPRPAYGPPAPAYGPPAPAYRPYPAPAPYPPQYAPAYPAVVMIKETQVVTDGSSGGSSGQDSSGEDSSGSDSSAGDDDSDAGSDDGSSDSDSSDAGSSDSSSSKPSKHRHHERKEEIEIVANTDNASKAKAKILPVNVNVTANAGVKLIVEALNNLLRKGLLPGGILGEGGAIESIPAPQGHDGVTVDVDVNLNEGSGHGGHHHSHDDQTDSGDADASPEEMTNLENNLEKMVYAMKSGKHGHHEASGNLAGMPPAAVESMLKKMLPGLNKHSH